MMDKMSGFNRTLKNLSSKHKFFLVLQIILLFKIIRQTLGNSAATYCRTSKSIMALKMVILNLNLPSAWKPELDGSVTSPVSMFNLQ